VAIKAHSKIKPLHTWRHPPRNFSRLGEPLRTATAVVLSQSTECNKGEHLGHVYPQSFCNIPKTFLRHLHGLLLASILLSQLSLLRVVPCSTLSFQLNVA